MNLQWRVNGVGTPSITAPWDSEELKQNLIRKKEIFIGVKVEKFVNDPSGDIGEKGMTSVPLVAYNNGQDNI